MYCCSLQCCMLIIAARAAAAAQVLAGASPPHTHTVGSHHHPTPPQVSIDSNYAALVVGVCVIVGFATSLDRRVNLMDAATPCFLFYSLIGRVSGRLYM